MNRTAKIRVYLVDDHPISRMGLRQAIQNDRAFEVVGEAGDDVTALAEIARLKPAIAVVDVSLPHSGGVNLVRALRNLSPSPACIMLTMHAEETTFNAAMDAGAQGYVLKDDSIEVTLMALKAVATGSVYLSPTVAGWILRRQQKISALKESKTGLSSLTPTERRILQLVADNMTSREIAARLFISHRTVETHRSNICQKLELQGAHRLLQFAIEHRSEL